MEKEKITIDLEEYKELLIIKGKYEQSVDVSQKKIVYVPSKPIYPIYPTQPPMDSVKWI